MSNSRKVDIQTIADWLKALSNPHRLEIFLRVLNGCESDLKACCEEGMASCIGELGRELGIGASTVSHHIKELRLAGLINVQRQGQKVVCWADRGTLTELIEFFYGLKLANKP